MDRQYTKTRRSERGLISRLWAAAWNLDAQGKSRWMRLPKSPRTGSKLPWLTSIHAAQSRGPWGDASYPGNCGGYLIKDLLRFFGAKRVLDPMEGSGTCAGVCEELGIECVSADLKSGFDATDPAGFAAYVDDPFDFVWMHPPYWRMKVYSSDPRDLSTAPTLEEFLKRYEQVIHNCAEALLPQGHMAILMGDYTDKEYGFVPLVYFTKLLCFRAGLRQVCTDIVRLSHGASSSHRSYRSKFIPGLHDIVTIVGYDEQADDRLREPKDELLAGVSVEEFLNGQSAGRDE
jgi:hypothetical protein